MSTAIVITKPAVLPFTGAFGAFTGAAGAYQG